jgi:hypothetical protein
MAVVIGKSRGLLASMPASLFGKFSLNGKAQPSKPAEKPEVPKGKKPAKRAKKKK